MTPDQFQNFSRRSLFQHTGTGLGSIALASLLQEDLLGRTSVGIHFSHRSDDRPLAMRLHRRVRQGLKIRQITATDKVEGMGTYSRKSAARARFPRGSGR